METLPAKQIEEMLQQGENSSIEFKNAKTRPDSIAREMVAFANTLGGTIFLGIEDNSNLTGINRDNLEEWITKYRQSSDSGNYYLKGKPQALSNIGREILDMRRLYQSFSNEGRIKSIISTSRTSSFRSFSCRGYDHF